MKGSLLHVGCGGDPLPEWAQGFKEIRLDIDQRHTPDIVASMTAMGDIGPFDAILCQHALEHLYPHEVSRAAGEFHRVLKDGGYAMVFVPDLEDVKATDEQILMTTCGPITGLDMIYGWHKAIENQPHMAHHSGFVQGTLGKVFDEAGFSKVEVKRLENYNLMAVAVK